MRVALAVAGVVIWLLALMSGIYGITAALPPSWQHATGYWQVMAIVLIVVAFALIMAGVGLLAVVLIRRDR